uniref:Methyltransferase 23, arginine n=2 Tax=Pongo abelii TaxID=9601 RepID=A0A8I5T5W7_PONAB
FALLRAFFARSAAGLSPEPGCPLLAVRCYSHVTRGSPLAQSGGPEPSAVPRLPGAQRRPTGRARFPRTGGPDPALSILGGAGPGGRRGRPGGPRPAGPASPVWNVCLALCCGPGPVPLVSQKISARQGHLRDFEDILATIYFLMHKNPKVQLWSTYQVRSADWSLEALLYKWDMKCVRIPLESFDADKEDIAESTLPGRHTVEMLVISFAKDSL